MLKPLSHILIILFKIVILVTVSGASNLLSPIVEIGTPSISVGITISLLFPVYFVKTSEPLFISDSLYSNSSFTSSKLLLINISLVFFCVSIDSCPIFFDLQELNPPINKVNTSTNVIIFRILPYLLIHFLS